MSKTLVFSQERRALSKSCRALRNLDKDSFYKMPEQDGAEEIWLSIEEYYKRLLKLDEASSQAEPDMSSLTVDVVRRKYLKIKERQAFEIKFYYKERKAACRYHKDEIEERFAAIADNQEPDLLELEQNHVLLDKINAVIIQGEIIQYPGRQWLLLHGSGLTRFPENVIKENFSFFQSLQGLSCENNQLIKLPESLSKCASLSVANINCFDNYISEPQSGIVGANLFDVVLMLGCQKQYQHVPEIGMKLTCIATVAAGFYCDRSSYFPMLVAATGLAVCLASPLFAGCYSLYKSSKSRSLEGDDTTSCDTDKQPRLNKKSRPW